MKKTDGPLLERNCYFANLSCWRIRGEFLERECWRSDHMTQSVNEQIGVLAAIEAKGHFVQVGGEMLCGDAMPSSNDAAFEQRERRFDGVGMDVPVNVNLGLVLDGLVLPLERRITQGRGVGIEFICHDDIYIFANALSDILCQRSSLHILSMEEAEIATALPDANNDLLFAVSVSGFAVSSLACTDVSFIYFDSTVHQGPLYFFHGSTNAMAQVPRRFVRAFVQAPQGTLELMSAHAFLGFAEKMHSGKPGWQREMRVAENRTSEDGELIDASLAKVKFLCRRQFDSIGLAAWAANAFGPAEPFEQFAASVVGSEHLV